MSPTGIEWVLNPDGSRGSTLNPFTGCLNHTPEGLCLDGLFPCYADNLANGRLKPLYLANENVADCEIMTYPRHIECIADPFYPRFWEERLSEMIKRNDRLWYDGTNRKYARAEAFGTSKGIFVCDMGDLFGMGVPEQWTERVIDEIWGNKGYDRFYILTKQAQRLPQFSPFPENCWVGVTATTRRMFVDGMDAIHKVKAKVIYISFEPLLEWHIDSDIYGELKAQQVDWLIIGACTGTWHEMYKLCERYPELTLMPWGKKWTAQPPIKWLREIVEAADRAGVKVFMKNNLRPLLWNEKERVLIPDWARMHGEYDGLEGFVLRQEMPKRIKKGGSA